MHDRHADSPSAPDQVVAEEGRALGFGLGGCASLAALSFAICAEGEDDDTLILSVRSIAEGYRFAESELTFRATPGVMFPRHVLDDAQAVIGELGFDSVPAEIAAMSIMHGAKLEELVDGRSAMVLARQEDDIRARMHDEFGGDAGALIADDMVKHLRCGAALFRVLGGQFEDEANADCSGNDKDDELARSAALAGEDELQQAELSPLLNMLLDHAITAEEGRGPEPSAPRERPEPVPLQHYGPKPPLVPIWFACRPRSCSHRWSTRWAQRCRHVRWCRCGGGPADDRWSVGSTQRSGLHPRARHRRRLVRWARSSGLVALCSQHRSAA